MRGIALDYGGVLADDVTPGDAARAAAALGVRPEHLVAAVYGPERSLWNQAKIGDLTEREHWEQAGHALDLPAARMPELRRLFDEPRLHPAWLAFLREVRSRCGPSLRLALVSNAIPCFTAIWRRLGLFELFDIVINSSEVRYAKPDPLIFHLTLARLGVDGAHCAFVDDKRANVRAAEAAGMHGVLCRGDGEAIAEVEAWLGRGT